MDLSRAIYSRDLKIAAMRALDAGATTGEIARKYQVSPHLLERWRGEWRAKGDLAFPGIGRLFDLCGTTLCGWVSTRSALRPVVVQQEGTLRRRLASYRAWTNLVRIKR